MVSHGRVLFSWSSSDAYITASCGSPERLNSYHHHHHRLASMTLTHTVVTVAATENPNISSSMFDDLNEVGEPPKSALMTDVDVVQTE